MVADLQELVDGLAEVLDRPVALDDREWQLLAASAYLGEDDAVRRHSLLARTVAPEVAAWLLTLGIQRETGAVETPENPELEMRARTVVPVRHENVALGYLWVIAGDVPLDASEREALEASARNAADLLWARRSENVESRRREAARLATLLDGVDPDGRARAAAELRERPGWEARSGSSFALALARLGQPGEAAAVGGRARRRWSADDLLWRARGTELTVLARLPAGKQLGELAAVLEQAGARCAAAIEADPLERAHASVATATDLLVVLERQPQLGPTATAAELGAWPLLARLWSALGKPARIEGLEPILAHRSAPQLLEALAAVLDATGDTARAAGAIHVHRSTLYRRLETVEELTGLSLARGEDRLWLHLALRLHALADGPGPAE